MRIFNYWRQLPTEIKTLILSYVVSRMSVSYISSVCGEFYIICHSSLFRYNLKELLFVRRLCAPLGLKGYSDLVCFGDNVLTIYKDYSKKTPFSAKIFSIGKPRVSETSIGLLFTDGKLHIMNINHINFNSFNWYSGINKYSSIMPATDYCLNSPRRANMLFLLQMTSPPEFLLPVVLQC